MKSIFLPITCLAACSSASLAGTITTYADRAAFTAAAGGPLSIEDFTDARHFPILSGKLNSHTDESFADGPPIQPGDLRAGITYSTLVDQDHVFNIDFGAGYTHGFLDALALNGSAKTPLIIEFHEDDPMVGRPISAFGFDMGSLRNGGDTTLIISFVGADDQTFDLDYPINLNVGFFGFISDAADISAVSIINEGSTNTSFDLDNFTFNAIPDPSDLNGDCVTDAADLGILIGEFGTSGVVADINGDGIVDAADLGILISNFGAPCGDI